MSSKRIAVLASVCVTFYLTMYQGIAQQAQTTASAAHEPIVAWAAKPATLVPYVPPNRLIWRLADILATHKGQQDWTESVVNTRDFIGQWISLGPHEKTKTVFYADDRIYFVVQQGALRVTIEGQNPFVATKGYLVQVPERVAYSMQTVSDDPSLRFEVRPSGEAPQYPSSETPVPYPGIEYERATYTATPGHYDKINRPYIDFETQVVKNGEKIGVWVQDDHTAANILRSQHGVPTPPSTSWGHFHENFPEFWFILEGTQQFLVEGEPLVTAVQGDLVATPIGRWHRASAYGDGPSTRIAIIPRPNNLHWFQAGASTGD
jgi:mannose-6-phosphate isomerase-like protein (cupin superfamily)